MKKGFHLFLLAILLMVSVLLPSMTRAEGTGQQLLKDLDRLSQEVLSLTERGQWADAKGKLDQLSDLFTQIGTNKKISIEALELASNTIVQGKQSFSDVTPNKQQMLWHATQIRILIDAFTHVNQPIWKGYHTHYMEQISKMRQSAERKDLNELMKALQVNMKVYSILKPAFAINQSPSTMEMLDSLYKFLLRQSHEQHVDWGAIQSSLGQLQEVSENVFMGEEEHTFAWYMSSNSPYAMISIMSLILVSALTYVAWRMYRGERFQA